ncbi:hypothetical protein DFH06DRAFT_1138014 [Mycena polygramma]|nr:hypothetical protein DFH06DRAFT_1138014 [Mycena polygramma]
MSPKLPGNHRLHSTREFHLILFTLPGVPRHVPSFCRSVSSISVLSPYLPERSVGWSCPGYTAYAGFVRFGRDNSSARLFNLKLNRYRLMNSYGSHAQGGDYLPVATLRFLIEEELYTLDFSKRAYTHLRLFIAGVQELAANIVWPRVDSNHLLPQAHNGVNNWGRQSSWQKKAGSLHHTAAGGVEPPSLQMIDGYDRAADTKTARIMAAGGFEPPSPSINGRVSINLVRPIFLSGADPWTIDGGESPWFE